MNVQSVCSVLDKGSRVRISAQGTHKSPHLNGVEGVIHAMPVHPTTWFKVQFPSGEIATFRSSALIPLDINGAPIPGFGAENRASSAAYRQDSKGISSISGERDDVETIYGSGNRRVLREHSGHYLNSTMDQDHSTSRSSRPRSSSLGPGGRAVSTGFRSNFYTNASNSRFTSKATEADRKIFNDFVEVAYASAYVPDCAHNTHGQGVIATKQLANEGPCDKCGIRRVRAGSVAGGFCWNSYCPSSPLYGRGAKQQPREERPHSRSMSSFHSEAEMARADGMQGRNEAGRPTIKDVNASDSTFYPVSPVSSSSSLTHVGSSMSLSTDGVGHGTDRNGHMVSSSSSTTSSAECTTSDNYMDVSMQTPMGGGDGSGATDTRTPNGFQKVASSDSNGSVGAEGERGGARSWSFHSADSDGTLSQSFGGLVADPDSAFTSIKDEGGDEKPIKTRGVRAKLSDPDDQGQMATVVSDQALSELSGSAGEGGVAITTATIDTAATANSSQAGQSRPDPSDAGAAALPTEQAVTTGPTDKTYLMNVEYEPWQKRPRRAE